MQSSQPGGPAGGEQRLFAQPSFPEIYEQALVGPIFRPWVESLLDDVQLKTPDRVLDVGCGTGIVARLAKERLGPDGTVVAVDLNPQMLAVARRVAPEIDWREGDACALPIREGEQFDVLLSQQGFQFFADKLAAARQMHRALAKGGRLGVSTWRPDEEFPVLRELRAIAERQLGPIADARHSLGDTGPLQAALKEAGFQDVRAKQMVRTVRFQDGAVFARLNAQALVGMSAQAGTLDEDGRKRTVAAIAEASAAVVGAHSDASGFAFELGANVVTAKA